MGLLSISTFINSTQAESYQYQLNLSCSIQLINFYSLAALLLSRTNWILRNFLILSLVSIFHDLSLTRFLKVSQIFRNLSIINNSECIVKVSLFDHASVNTFLGIYYFFWHFYSFVGRKTKAKYIFNVDENFQKFEL